MNTKDEEEVAEFRSRLEGLRKQLLDASVYFDIWVQLFPTAQVVGVINQYSGFFLPVRNALFSQFSIKVCNVLSNDSKSPSLYRVLSMLDSNPNLVSGIAAREVKNRLKKHRRVLRGIEQYRKTKAAHWDTNISEPQEPVLFGDSKRMLKELQDIFNQISVAHSGKSWSFKYLLNGNTESLMNALKIHVNMRPRVLQKF